MRAFLVTASTLLALGTGSAVAADLRVAPVKAPAMVVAQAFNWSGFYVGGHCGAAWGRTRTTGDDGAFDEAGSETIGLSPSGWFCGGQAGYNFQAGNWVFGVEGDLGYLGVKKTFTDLNVLDNFVEVKYGLYGTATGRLGVAWDRVLLYAKGGAAFARIRNSAGDIIDGTSNIDPTDFSEVTKTKFGYAIGGGLEYAFAPNWSIKGEYLYMDFGRISGTNAEGDLFEHRNRLHTAKIGVNYRFGVGPVVAKY